MTADAGAGPLDAGDAGGRARDWRRCWRSRRAVATRRPATTAPTTRTPAAAPRPRSASAGLKSMIHGLVDRDGPPPAGYPRRRDQLRGRRALERVAARRGRSACPRQRHRPGHRRRRQPQRGRCRGRRKVETQDQADGGRRRAGLGPAARWRPGHPRQPRVRHHRHRRPLLDHRLRPGLRPALEQAGDGLRQRAGGPRDHRRPLHDLHRRAVPPGHQRSGQRAEPARGGLLAEPPTSSASSRRSSSAATGTTPGSGWPSTPIRRSRPTGRRPPTRPSPPA